VFGLVVGAFGELSPAFCELANAIARVLTLKHLSYFACRKDHAFEMHKQSMMRFWRLTAQRGWARLILYRPDALAHCSAATMHGNASGHVDDAAENIKTSYTLATGTVPLTAPASAGAVVVHEFLWCVFQCVSCCRISLNYPPFGGMNTSAYNKA
jgi:hypothetical protein